MSLRKTWDSHLIVSDQTPEANIAVAEGNGFVSLKAYINPSSDPPSYVKTWIDERGLDFNEYSRRHHEFCVGLILSFSPENLEIDIVEETHWREIEPIITGRSMKNLRSLVMPCASRKSASTRSLEPWHMPLLRHLEIAFVPGAALGEGLVRCSLYDIEEAEFDSLKVFLAAAKSLQELQRFLSKNARRFYEVCNLPSLRSLEVDFDPHPSRARDLVRTISAVKSGGFPVRVALLLILAWITSRTCHLQI